MTHDAVSRLTARETDVLLRLEQGLTALEIAQALSVSFETVRMYLKRIRDKTGLRRKAQLVVFAATHHRRLQRRCTKEAKACRTTTVGR